MKLSLLASLPLLAAAGPGGVRRDLQAVVYKNKQKFTDPFTNYASCADPPEALLCSGVRNLSSTTTINGNHFSYHYHFNWQGVKCVGQISGDIYKYVNNLFGRGSGVFVNDAFTTGELYNLKLIGPGPDNIFTSKQRVKTTVNANGEITVEIDSGVEYGCKGE